MCSRATTNSGGEVIIGALVLQAGLDQGLEPVAKGRRVVVPGSRPIRRKLEDLGLLDVYRRAKFSVGVPGCSMCIGQGTDQAQPGEHWLSSQNRNFKNRMGPGMLIFHCSSINCSVSYFSFMLHIIWRNEFAKAVVFHRVYWQYRSSGDCSGFVFCHANHGSSVVTRSTQL